MMFFKTWERYLFRETFKVFFLFLASFYFLYIFIDYSTHASLFRQAMMSAEDVVIYYLCQFSREADLLLLLAFLLATIRVLTSLNLHREAVALLAGGISAKRILVPLWCIAAMTTLALYANAEWVSPWSATLVQKYRERQLQEKMGYQEKHPVHEIFLKDGSRLLYMRFDRQAGELSDVFWLKTFDDIYRIKTFHLNPGRSPSGEHVDHLVRNDERVLVKAESFDHYLFEAMPPPKNSWTAITLAPKDLSLSAVWKHPFPRLHKALSDDEAQAFSAFYYKLFFPLATFLLLMGLAPFALRFGRNFHSFPIYALGIFSLVAFSTLMDAANILGATQVFPPFLALAVPTAAAFITFGGLFVRWR